jgi:hypothetical protein
MQNGRARICGWSSLRAKTQPLGVDRSRDEFLDVSNVGLCSPDDFVEKYLT